VIMARIRAILWGRRPTRGFLSRDRLQWTKTQSKIIFVSSVVHTFLAFTGVQAVSAATADFGQKTELPAALSNAELSKMSGGASSTGVAVTSQTLSATNSQNSVSANSVITGNVTLQSGTFNGFNGVGNFVFNTGNNNNVQGSLSVTIITPPLN